jgi:hypothetical protein
MKYINSTYEILQFKAPNRDVTEVWINWAIDMVSAGFETEHLIILAGISKPYNQFYLQDLTSKVFNELSLDFSSVKETSFQYATFLAGEVQAGCRNQYEVLQTLKQVCQDLDYPKELMDFCLLFWAVDDLRYTDMQHYWNGANRKNIDSIISDYFEKCVQEHPLGGGYSKES